MQPILLDTHAFIWAMDNQLHHFSPHTQQQLEASLHQRLLYLPAISLWEVSMLATKQRISLSLPVEHWLKQAITRSGIRILPIDIATATLSSTLTLHGDPADRLIVAGAICHKMLLCSQDNKIMAFATESNSLLHILPLS